MLVSLNSVSIPNTFYNIRQGVNDRIPFRVWHLTYPTPGFVPSPAVPVDPGVVHHDLYDVTLKSGNYPVTTKTKTYLGVVQHDPFAEEVLTKMKIGTASRFPNNTFTMVADTETMRYEYEQTNTSTDAAQVAHATSIEFFPPEHTAAGVTANKEMGFADNALLSARQIFGSRTSQNVYDFFGSVHGLMVRTSMSQKGVMDSQTGAFGNILARVPIDAQPGGVIFHQPMNSTHRNLVAARHIDSITVRVSDERNRLIDLNGLHMNLAILVERV